MSYIREGTRVTLNRDVHGIAPKGASGRVCPPERYDGQANVYFTEPPYLAGHVAAVPAEACDHGFLT